MERIAPFYAKALFANNSIGPTDSVLDLGTAYGTVAFAARIMPMDARGDAPYSIFSLFARVAATILITLFLISSRVSMTSLLLEPAF